MKPSWIIGIVILALWIAFNEMVVSNSGVFAPEITSNSGILMNPIVQSVAGGAVAFIFNTGKVLVALFHVLSMPSATIFSGYMAWVWWFVIFPIVVGTAIVIILIRSGNA
jgi:hypothetical protein